MWQVKWVRFLLLAVPVYASVQFTRKGQFQFLFLPLSVPGLGKWFLRFWFRFRFLQNVSLWFWFGSCATLERFDLYHSRFGFRKSANMPYWIWTCCNISPLQTLISYKVHILCIGCPPGRVLAWSEDPPGTAERMRRILLCSASSRIRSSRESFSEFSRYRDCLKFNREQGNRALVNALYRRQFLRLWNAFDNSVFEDSKWVSIETLLLKHDYRRQDGAQALFPWKAPTKCPVLQMSREIRQVLSSKLRCRQKLPPQTQSWNPPCQRII